MRPELCGGAVTTEADWREGVRRLGDYHALLTVARRRRALAAGQNPYLDLVQVLAADHGPGWSLPRGLASVLDLPARRRELAALFAWAIPDAGALATLARYGPLLECGAGTGYWAALLRASGADIEASDLTPPGGAENAYHDSHRRPWSEVRAASAVGAVRASPGRTLFLCWPPHDDDDASYRALRAYRGEVLVYIGGGPGRADRHRSLPSGAGAELARGRADAGAELAGAAGPSRRLPAEPGPAAAGGPRPVR